MELKKIIFTSLFCAVAGGIIGAAIVLIYCKDKGVGRQIEADTIKVKVLTVDEIISRDKDGTILCSIKNGDIKASKLVLGNQVRANFLVGKTVIAASNPLARNFKQCQIFAEMGAGQDGGLMVLRNKTGPLIPAIGKVKNGRSLNLMYTKQGLPIVYAENIVNENKKVTTIYTTREEKLKPASEVKKTAKAKKKGGSKSSRKRRK